MQNHGVNESHVSFTDKGIKHLISYYTKEAGLRNLSREVGSLCRKIAKKVVIGDALQQYVITPTKITELLGPAKYLKETQLKESKIGVTTGLAWTQAGGEILYVEAIRISSSTNKGIILTGQLGKVMEESAQAAYSYIRMYAEKVGIASQWFKKNEIHIHLPAGATPKDGPSAGVTLATTLISLITNTPVRKDIAMTGEIGLQGQILPVGGIKEKCLAALSHGIMNVILPLKNKADIENTTFQDKTLKELR
ncbi:MAG: endopeptidase La, partial [Bdellovibrionaceae bacterium]|nr:endopeptidase La [Pseudobdellovibrionaceae bacterium]